MKTILLLFIFVNIFSCNSQISKSELIDKIPFELIDDAILIKLVVNGFENQVFILDTGAGGTLISKTLGDKLGLVNGNKFNNSGAAGINQIESYSNNYLKIGDVKIDDVVLMKNPTNLSKTSVLGAKVDGIVGYDILSKYGVKINYSTNQIELYTFGEFVESDFGEKYEFGITHNIPYLILDNIRIGKEKLKGKFLIDTGAQPNLVFTSPFVRDNNLESKVAKFFVVVREVGTSKTKTKSIVCKTQEISLFASKFEEIPTILSTAKRGALSFTNFQGIIGNRLLKKFDITFNYAKKELYVKPNPRLNEKFKTNCFGAFYSRDDIDGKRLIIEGFINNSAADLSELKIGDEIIEVNDISIDTVTSIFFRDIFTRNGENIRIKYKRKGKIHQTKIRLKALI